MERGGEGAETRCGIVVSFGEEKGREMGFCVAVNQRLWLPIFPFYMLKSSNKPQRRKRFLAQRTQNLERETMKFRANLTTYWHKARAMKKSHTNWIMNLNSIVSIN